MDIKELKRKIETKSLDDSPLVLIYKDSGKLICNQYIECISKFKNLQINYINSEDNLVSNLLFSDVDSNFLNVIVCDCFDSPYYLQDNHIICCHQVKNNIPNNYIVNIPEVESWQIEDYVKTLISGVNENKIKWLISICPDYYRLLNEVNKICIFPISLQENIFDILSANKNFEDLTSYNIFNLATAIQKRDIQSIKNILNEISNIEINPLGLSSILYSNFKEILQVKTASFEAIQKLKIQPKKLKALKYCAGFFTENQLLQILKLLSLTDYNIKNGIVSVDFLIDYLIIKILSF